MCILLTGGLGFIGTHVYVELANLNQEIIIVDNLVNSNISQLTKLFNLTGKIPFFYNYDMNDYSKLESIFQSHNITHVIHLAGLKYVGESVVNPLKYYNNNITILLNLLDIMKNHNCKNIIFSSSATVYGNNNIDVYDENMVTGQNLNNPYGKTKYFQEEILKDLFTSDKSFNITLLRYFNPTGTHQSGIIGDEPNGKPQMLFPCIFDSIKNNTQLKIYGNKYNTHDGTCIRDFIHVVDLAKAHVECLKCKGLNIFNVGTGKKTSVLDIILTFERVNNIKLFYETVEARQGDAECTCANCDKIFKTLGWKAEKTIEDMCRDSYRFYVKNNK